jgi:DNA-binding IclR family transcriptional regulator
VLIELLDKIRQNRYGLSDEELMRGVRGIATPIFNSEREVQGAINMPVPSQVGTRQELIKIYAPMLTQTARAISAARDLV